MKKLLLLLLISLGFIGLVNANPIDGAFGYKLGLVEKDAELQEDTSGFKYKSKSFIPSKVMPPFTSYTIKTTLTKNKIYEITAYVSKIKYDTRTLSCTQNIYFKDLLSALERKYKEHGKLRSFRMNNYMEYTFVIDDRSIALECEEDYDEMSMQLTYSDDKLLDMLKKANNIYSDFDI